MTKLISFFPFAAAVFLSTTAFASRSLILTNQTNMDINCVVAFWDTTSHTWVSGSWTRHIPNGGSAYFEEQYDIGYYHCEAINQPSLWAGNKDAYFCTPPGESGRMYNADNKAACDAAGRTMLPFGSTGGNSQITLRM